MTLPKPRLPACLLTLALAPAWAQDAAKASRFYEDALKRYENKDIPGAIVQLKNALQADKSQLSVQILLGRALLADSQPAAAEVALSDALKMGVNRAEVVVLLARCFVAQGRQSQMLGDTRLSPEGLPANAKLSLLLERALAMSDLGDTRNGLATVLEARRLDVTERRQPGSLKSRCASAPGN